MNLEIIIPIISLTLGYIGIQKCKYKNAKRNYFSAEDKHTTRYLKQKNRCQKCKKMLFGLVEYHHKNGHRSNNKISNCQVFHKKCHLKITNKNKMSYKNKINMSGLKWLAASTTMFFFYLLYHFASFQL